MATYTYRAFSMEGSKKIGSLRFDSKAQCEAHLQAKGFVDYKVYETATPYSRKHYKLVSAKELSIFSRQMSVLFVSDITLLEGMLLMSEQSVNKTLKTALKEMFAHMDVGGFTFAEAMGMYPHVFGTYMVHMAAIGENSGALDDVFAGMADYFEKEHEIRKKLRTAVTYPLILTLMMSAIVVLLIVEILPMFGELLGNMGGEMPAVTMALLAFSDFVSTYVLWIGLVIAAIVFASIQYAGTEKGAFAWDRKQMTAPLLRRVNALVATGRFARSMSLLLKSGVQLIFALEYTVPLLNNRYLTEKFDKVIEDVKNGTPLSEALKSVGIFSALFMQMVVIGERSGHLDRMLARSSKFFDEEVYDAVERITVMIEPILIIILSVIVGIILLSVMLPMITIMNAIG